MNYIVTGCSGFIGGHLVAALARNGERGILLSRSAPKPVPAGFQWVPWQAGQPAVIPTPLDDACLVHLAAKHHVPNPRSADVRAFYEINVEGTRQLLEDCTRLGIEHFIYFSTIKAAGPKLSEHHNTANHSPRTEADTECGLPDTAYGRSKREAEMWAEKWSRAEAGRSVVILRPAVVYGPGNTANIYSLVDGIARGRFFLAGKNDNVKSLVSVANVVAAVRHLAAQMSFGCQTYYVTDRRNYSVRELAGVLAELLGVHHSPRTLPLSLLRVLASGGDTLTRLTGLRAPIDSHRLSALIETTWFSCDKLVATGFRHPQTTREGLAEMVEWYLSEREGKCPAAAPSTSSEYRSLSPSGRASDNELPT